MTTILGKRKQPRREVPYVGTLLEKLPFSKLPTNGTVLRRLFFELEKTAGHRCVSSPELNRQIC